MSIASIFEIIGPIMVGPSSSHTAGAVRIGLAAYRFLGEEPVAVEITLFGSYAKGYRGHKTDVAILAGSLGFSVDDPRVPDALAESQARGIKVKIELGENADYHTNTAVVCLLGKSGRKIKVRGISIGGGNIEIEEAQVLAQGQSTTCTQCINCTNKNNKNEHSNAPKVYGLETCAELVSAAESRGLSLAEVIIEQEADAWGKTEAEIREMVANILSAMERAVQNGLKGNNKSIGGLTAQDAVRFQQAQMEGKLLGDRLYANAICWAMATNETNAAMGVVAAAPTGGACGTLPGALLAAADKLSSSRQELINGLAVAGGIGARVAAQTSLSASVAGCQVEVGVGVGMGAAAVVQLAGGSPSQCAHAAALGIKSFIGLTCGAPGGLVEVPCVKRNGIGAVAALAAADLALAGVESQVPLDEVIWALADTGRHLPSILLGTMPSGLAATPTGKALYRRIYGKEIGS
jgi:L-serine dehydratase